MIHVRLVVYWVYLVPVCAIVRNLFMCTKLCIEFTPLPVCVVVSILVSMVLVYSCTERTAYSYFVYLLYKVLVRAKIQPYLCTLTVYPVSVTLPMYIYSVKSCILPCTLYLFTVLCIHSIVLFLSYTYYVFILYYMYSILLYYTYIACIVVFYIVLYYAYCIHLLYIIFIQLYCIYCTLSVVYLFYPIRTYSVFTLCCIIHGMYSILLYYILHLLYLFYMSFTPYYICIVFMYIISILRCIVINTYCSGSVFYIYCIHILYVLWIVFVLYHIYSTLYYSVLYV